MNADPDPATQINADPQPSLEGADSDELVGDASVRLAVVHRDLGGAAMRDVLRQFHEVKCSVGDP